MQGITLGVARPSSKKAVKDAIASNPDGVYIEATSPFGQEYDGPAGDLPVGTKVSFVGPDPYTSRKFYGTIEWRNGALRVS
jgi:hypothetical protein